MIDLSGNGYTHNQVYGALHAKTAPRVVSFRYDLLSSEERKIKALSTVASGSISMSATAEIKKTGRFLIKEDTDIDYASHRIQPFFRLKMPDSGYREWPLGIYLLSSPKRKEKNGSIYRDVEAYDGLQVLRDDKFVDRYIITAGTNYVTAVKSILNSAGITKVNIEATSKTLPTAIEFEPGTTKLKAAYALLTAINYNTLYVDASGFYTSRQYVSPADRPVTYTYSDDPVLSVLGGGLSDELDLFSVPNKFVAFTSNPDALPLRSEYTNSNPLSPLSTVSRGRTIPEVRKVDDIADQSALDAFTAKMAFEASQVFGFVEMETAFMPFHDVNDVIRVEYSKLNIYEKFAEIGWSVTLKAGSRMKHTLRRVVNLL